MAKIPNDNMVKIPNDNMVKIHNDNMVKIPNDNMVKIHKVKIHNDNTCEFLKASFTRTKIQCLTGFIQEFLLEEKKSII